jgi:hypothetical protein
MNASLARRIRNAEGYLITALDRRKNGQRDPGRQYRPAQTTVAISRCPILKQNAGPVACSQSTPIN